MNQSFRMYDLRPHGVAPCRLQYYETHSQEKKEEGGGRRKEKGGCRLSAVGV